MYSDFDSGAFAALLIFWLAIFPILAIVGYVISALFIRKLLVLAGAQNPNLAWIPVYNGMLWAKLVDVNPWVFLIVAAGSGVLAGIPVLGWILALLPLALLIVMILRTNQKLGKEPVGWTIFGVLLSFIYQIVIIAQSGLSWRTGAQNGVAAPFWHKWGSFFHDTTTWAGIPYQGYPVSQGPTAPPQAPPPAAPPMSPPPVA